MVFWQVATRVKGHYCHLLGWSEDRNDLAHLNKIIIKPLKRYIQGNTLTLQLNSNLFALNNEIVSLNQGLIHCICGSATWNAPLVPAPDRGHIFLKDVFLLDAVFFFIRVHP